MANTAYISAGLPVAKNSGQSPTVGVNTAYVSAGLPPDVLSTPSGAITGSTSIMFTASGTLIDAGGLAGSSSITFAPSGTLAGAGALAGSTSLAFAASGTASTSSGYSWAREFVVAVDTDGTGEYTSLSAAWAALSNGGLDLSAADTRIVPGALAGTIADGTAVTQTTTAATATCVHHNDGWMLLKGITGTSNDTDTWFPTADGDDTTNSWTPSGEQEECSLRITLEASSGTADTTAPTLTGITAYPFHRIILQGELTGDYDLVYTTAKWRLEAASNDAVVLRLPSYCFATGLQVKNTSESPSAGSGAIGAVAGNPAHNVAWIENSIAVGGDYPVQLDATYTALIMRRVVAYGGATGAVYSSAYGGVGQNCTLIGSTYGVLSTGSNSIVRVINCYVSGTTCLSEVSSGTIPHTTTATSDASGDIPSIACDTTVAAGHAGFTNVGSGTEDFRTKAGSVLASGGTSLAPRERLNADISGIRNSYSGLGGVGAVMQFTNGSSVATVRWRDWTNHAWLDDYVPQQTINLSVAFSGATKAVAVASDLHVDTNATGTQALFDDIDDTLNPTANITDLVVIGDIVTDDETDYDTYTAIRDASDLGASHTYEIIGNHDETNANAGGSGGFEDEVGRDLQYTWDLDNVRFIMLGVKGTPGVDSLAWLSAAFIAAIGKNVIYCNHFGRCNRWTTWRESTEVAYSFRNEAWGGKSAYPWCARFNGHNHYSTLDSRKAFISEDAPDLDMWFVGADAIASPQGSTSITFAASGTLTGSGALTGSSSIAFAPSGTLSGTGSLTGSTTLTLGASGTLTGAGSLTRHFTPLQLFQNTI